MKEFLDGNARETRSPVPNLDICPEVPRVRKIAADMIVQSAMAVFAVTALSIWVRFVTPTKTSDL
jgi:hypothetical protein